MANTGNRRGSLGHRLRYEFDKSMAAGPIALMGWLAVISIIIIIVAAGVIALLHIAPDGSDPMGFSEAAWEALMRTLDSGTMGGDTGWGFRAVMLLVTLGGIFVVSALIGVLSTGIEGKLDELRKGRSEVIEKDHTIILNWSASIFDIISELTIANESRRRPRIVILADKDKVEMEDEIAAKVPNLKNTKVICRSGDPTDLGDLALTAPHTSRSIIVLSPDSDDPDSRVIKIGAGAGQRPASAARKSTRSRPKSATARTPIWPVSSAATRCNWCSPTSSSPASSSIRRASRASAPSTPSCSISTAAKSTPPSRSRSKARASATR